MNATPNKLSTESERWAGEIGVRFPNLSKPVATVLAMFSWGVMRAESCGRFRVASQLAIERREQVRTIEQRLYEWLVDAGHKSGKKRRDWQVDQCFAPLLKWIISLWQERRIGLALDATSCGPEFTILVISVVYRQMRLPVAWKVHRGDQAGGWNAIWLSLLDSIRGQIPADWTTLVLTDRGLFSRVLFEKIRSFGWHPYMRINVDGTFQVRSRKRLKPYQKITNLIRSKSAAHAVNGFAFQGKAALACTLTWCSDSRHATPWVILTDLPPKQSDAYWYGLRAWCEQGFKCLKRGTWQWQRTRVTDPTRADRCWLVLAVVTLWVVAIGSQFESDPELSRLFTGWLQTSSTSKYPVLRLATLGLLLFNSPHLNSNRLFPTRLPPCSWPSRPKSRVKFTIRKNLPP